MPAMTFESVLGKATEPTGCGVLVVRDGRILTGTRKERASRGQLCGPGGHIESGESPKEAAKREAFEEFGIICDDLKPLGVQDGGRYGRSAVFLCNRFRGTPKTDEEEMTDPKWLTISEIKRKDVFLPFKQSLELLPREKVLKFNPYHSPADGKFTSGPGGSVEQSQKIAFGLPRKEYKTDERTQKFFEERRKIAGPLAMAETKKEKFDLVDRFYSKYQEGTANKDNFFVNTIAEFKETSGRPRKQPDYVSYTRDGKVSSEYWYTKDGVIRGSTHWGTGIASCDWYMEGVGTNMHTKKLYGKANWSDFIQKPDIVTSGDKAVMSTFANTKGGRKLGYGISKPVVEGFNDNYNKSLTFDEILKFNPNHDHLGRFSSGPGGGSAVSDMKISTFSTGASGDEVYMRSEMKNGDKLAGYVEYSIYNDVPAIQYIHTEDDFKRQGVATKLMQDIQRQYPNTEIEFGMTTPDGTKLLDSITYEVKNEKVAAQKKELQSLKDEMTRNETELNRLYDKLDNDTLSEAENQKLDKLGERWDELNDGIRNLEDDLWGKKETMRFVRLDDTKKSITGGEDMNNDFTIFKADDEKHLVFGWASISVTIDGEELEDRQHDIIEPEDLEDAAYEYVLNFRDTGEEHIDTMRKKGRLVESCVFTKEKQRAIGIPDGSIPVGWWVGFKIDDEAAWERVKSGMYKMFSIEGRAYRKPIEKGKRSYDEYPEYEMWLEENLDATIDEQKAAKEYYFTQKKEAKTVAKTFDDILKFNPFHDHLGRFANKMGFKTYSANPKTKAGAMAISRSAQAGHGSTMNVHRESKGEDVGQNYRWLETGKKPDFVKPTTTKPQKPSKPEKPNQPKQDPDTKQPKSNSELAESVANVKLSSAQKTALEARDWNGNRATTKEIAKDSYQERIAGKDLSGSIDVKGSDKPLDVVVKAQGWDKAPTVVNDRDTFDKLCLQSGRVLIRSVDGNHRTGESADEVCRKTMTEDSFALNGTGGRVYGTGMYMVDTSIKNASGRKLENNIRDGQYESFCYGGTQMMATVHPSAKIATSSQVSDMRSEFYGNPKLKKQFNNDVNSYIASKGYDGAKMHDDSNPTAYTTIFNRSALIFYGGVAKSR